MDVTTSTAAPTIIDRVHAEVRLALSGGGDDEWVDSPYRWLRELPPRRRGKVGEEIVAGIARSVHLPVGPGGRGADRSLGPLLVEVKLSTRWADGSFTFQQLRDQEYGTVALVGVDPDRIRIWWVPKPVLWDLASAQHGGRGGSDTRWWSFPSDNVPELLAPYGGDAELATSMLAAVASCSVWH